MDALLSPVYVYEEDRRNWMVGIFTFKTISGYPQACQERLMKWDRMTDLVEMKKALKRMKFRYGQNSFNWTFSCREAKRRAIYRLEACIACFEQHGVTIAKLREEYRHRLQDEKDRAWAKRQDAAQERRQERERAALRGMIRRYEREQRCLIEPNL